MLPTAASVYETLGDTYLKAADTARAVNSYQHAASLPSQIKSSPKNSANTPQESSKPLSGKHMKLTDSEKRPQKAQHNNPTDIARMLADLLSMVPAILCATKSGNGVARLTRVFEHHRSDVWVVKFFPDGQEMASCSVDGTLKIFEAVPAAFSKYWRIR